MIYRTTLEYSPMHESTKSVDWKRFWIREISFIVAPLVIVGSALRAGYLEPYRLQSLHPVRLLILLVSLLALTAMNYHSARTRPE